VYSKVVLDYAAPPSGVMISQRSSQTKPLLGLACAPEYDDSEHIALLGEWGRYVDLDDNHTADRSDVKL
jgi:hypothetical protein